jgi:hypothetical protein
MKLLSKSLFFGAKSSGIAHTKTALAYHMIIFCSPLLKNIFIVSNWALLAYR